MKRITFGRGVMVLPAPGDPISFRARVYARPLVTKPPAITGSGTVGAAQSFVPGLWLNGGTVTATWWLDGQEVGSGTTYTPTVLDKGKTLTVLERATNASGLSASSRSAGVVIP